MNKQIVAWLDRQIELRQELGTISKVGESIETCTPEANRIHIYEGVVELANACDCTLDTRPCADEYEYLFFHYKGVEVYELIEKEERDE